MSLRRHVLTTQPLGALSQNDFCENMDDFQVVIWNMFELTGLLYNIFSLDNPDICS